MLDAEGFLYHVDTFGEVTTMSYRIMMACLYSNFISHGNEFKSHLESSREYTIDLPHLGQNIFCKLKSVPLKKLKFYDGCPQLLKKAIN